MPTPRDRYVYLLRDPRVEDDRANIIYVGVGIGNRALDHIAEAKAHIKRIADEAMKVINARQGLVYASVNAPDRAEQVQELEEAEEVRIDADAKLDLIADILNAGLDVRIDTIHRKSGTYLTQTEAFLVEAGLIAALDMKGFGNDVAGRHLAIAPESVFTKASRAVEVDIPAGHHGIIVPLSPKPIDYERFGGHLLAAPDDYLWERGRRWWGSSAPEVVADFEDAIADPSQVSPTVIIVTKNPITGAGNIVVGVHQLAALGPASDGDERWEYWRQGRAEEDAATTTLRDALLGNTLRIDGRLVTHRQDRTYFGR